MVDMLTRPSFTVLFLLVERRRDKQCWQVQTFNSLAKKK